MKRKTVILLFGSLACLAMMQNLTDERALSIAGALKKALGSKLMASIQEGGPEAAVELCALEALPLTSQIAREQGLELSRITDRPRNPQNGATPEELALLMRMQEDLKDNRLQAIYRLGEVAYHPLEVQPLCLICHGGEIGPDLAQTLKEKYPGDRATGYKMGQIRGAIKISPGP